MLVFIVKKINIPKFRMLFQFNDSQHCRCDEARSIFNTGFFKTVYNSCQKRSITLFRTSLMHNGIGKKTMPERLNSFDKISATYCIFDLRIIYKINIVFLFVLRDLLPSGIQISMYAYINVCSS